jgi:hypothetical protein
MVMVNLLFSDTVTAGRREGEGGRYSSGKV